MRNKGAPVAFQSERRGKVVSLDRPTSKQPARLDFSVHATILTHLAPPLSRTKSRILSLTPSGRWGRMPSPMTTTQKLGPVRKISGAIRASHWHLAGSFYFMAGAAGLGTAWRGGAWQARQGGAGRGKAGRAWRGRHGEAGRGWAGPGAAGTVERRLTIPRGEYRSLTSTTKTNRQTRRCT